MSRGEKEGKAESLLFDTRLKMKENGSWVVKSQDLARERGIDQSLLCIIWRLK